MKIISAHSGKVANVAKASSFGEYYSNSNFGKLIKSRLSFKKRFVIKD